MSGDGGAAAFGGPGAEYAIGGHAGGRSPLWARTGDIKTAIYSNSLLIAMGGIFIASWFAQSVTGWTQYNDELSVHGEPGVSWLGYVSSATFLGVDVPELAVRVPRGRLVRGARDLPQAARLTGVEAGGRPP